MSESLNDLRRDVFARTLLDGAANFNEEVWRFFGGCEERLGGMSSRRVDMREQRLGSVLGSACLRWRENMPPAARLLTAADSQAWSM
jgi:hypothetical protein